MPWFISYANTHLVWLSEVLSVNYHHNFNANEPVVGMFYVVGCLYRAIFISSTLPKLQNQISSDPWIQ